MENLKKEYENFGFFKMQNAVDKILINKIINEINSVKKNVDIYYDRKDNLRRIERLYDKGEGLKAANKKILNLLKEIFNFEFTIFKDKFNAKPPEGEGFLHIMTEFLYSKMKIMKIRRVGMNTVIFLLMF